MTSGGPPDDGIEAELRSTLRGDDDGSDRTGVERDLLLAVHRNASRRRRRRRLAACTIAVAGVSVTAGVVATQLPQPAPAPSAGGSEVQTTPLAESSTGPSPNRSTAESSQPSARPTQSARIDSAMEPGEPVQPSNVEVESVTAVQSNQFWVLGSAQCQQTSCQVIAHTTDAGKSFSFRTGPTPTEGDAPPPVAPLTSTPTPSLPVDAGAGPDLRYAVTGTDGWGYAGEVWSTHDAGVSWAPVEMPVPAEIFSVQSEETTVWAFGTARGNGAPVVFSAPVGADTWSATEPGLAVTDRMDVPIVAEGITGALVTSADGKHAYLRTLDGGTSWELAPLRLNCETPLSASGVTGALWLYCTSPEGGTVAVSTDSGSTGQEQRLPPPSSPLTTMTGIDATHALLTDGRTVSIVTMASGIEPVAAPYDEDDQVWNDVGYTFAGFTDSRTGYLITSGGELARSDDGGRDWSAVELP
ncbi:hypothetical protein BH18ACT8_BH18ACT8_17670 [soil metagenome]